MLDLSAIASGLLVGLTLGLLGSGGSILALPLLVGFVGLDVHAAVPNSLAAVGAIAAWGTARNLWRRAMVEIRPALLFAAISCVGTVFGARLSHRIDEHLLLGLFGILVCIVGVKMLLPARNENSRSNVVSQRRLSTRLACLAALALGTGLLSGLLGVGGGFLIVPSLVLVLGLAVRQAVPVSLLVIALNSAVGVAAFAFQGNPVNLPVLGGFLLGGAAGMFLGQRLLGVLPERALRLGFAVLFLVMAGLLARRGLA